MDYTLNEIKDLRKKFNLTQGELAKRADVSQSLIAKIEAGRIDPTYSKTKKIFATLDSLTENDELTVKELMNKKIITVSPSDSLRSAIKKMKRYEISQMPVLANDKPAGVICEASILSKMAEVDNPEKIVKLQVKDVMNDCPPILPKDAKTRLVSSLLQHYPIVLIGDAGKIVGLVTKSDILSTLYQHK